jgi:hypothetical protein
VEPRKVSQYISFGSKLRYLQDARAGRRVHGKSFTLDNIDSFIGFVEKFKLTVTERALRDLKQVRETLAATPDDYALDVSDARALVKAIREIRLVLEAETGGMVAYILTDKRYDVNRLLESVWELLDDGVYAWLDAIAKYDMEQAGKSLAVELPTAAAFHVLRGTEQGLRQYYRTIIRRNRIAEPWLWGPLVKDLRDNAPRARRPPDEIFYLLDHIRLSYRNPTDHPEKIYDMQEAQNVFGLCGDALGRLYRHCVEVG